MLGPSHKVYHQSSVVTRVEEKARRSDKPFTLFSPEDNKLSIIRIGKEGLKHCHYYNISLINYFAQGELGN
jgi:hypothetical protein